MTMKPTSTTAEADEFVRLPDPPEPEDMHNHLYLNLLGNAMHLAKHFGNEDTTLIMAGVYVSWEPVRRRDGLFEPDLLIAFNTNLAACITRNGYVISEQGKPPDFVLEIGSSSTGNRDVTVKRDGYAALHIPEYWRFDPSGGSYHRGAALAGDRLEAGTYQPMPIETIAEGVLQGYSPALNLHLRWDHGQLGWHDPVTGRHILTFDDERERADAAEARVRELEAELERRRGNG